MPLLLRPSPATGRALAWRGSSHDAAAASRVTLTPLAAVRHLFRDHSSGSQHDPSNGRHGSQLHRHHLHHHHHHRHPNQRKAPELSHDWASLYLGAKLALWSGLCYFPYDTIPRTLQEEGLKLVAYGRTSFTCWYVADGQVDFEALPRRAFPPPRGPRSPQSYSPRDHHVTQPSEQQHQLQLHEHPAERSDMASALSTSSASDAHGASAGSSGNNGGVSSGTLQPPLGPLVHRAPTGGNALDGLPGGYAAAVTAAAVADGNSGGGGGALQGAASSSSNDSGSGSGLGSCQPHDPVHSQDSDHRGSCSPPGSHGSGGHVRNHSHTPGRHGHGQGGVSGGHTCRDDLHPYPHLHLHRQQPTLQLKVPRGDLRTHSGRGDGGGSSSSSSSSRVSGGCDWPPGVAALSCHHPPPAGGPPPTSPGDPGTRCRFIFLRGVQWAAPETNTLSLSASLATFWPSQLLPAADPVVAAGGTVVGTGGSGGGGAGGVPSAASPTAALPASILGNGSSSSPPSPTVSPAHWDQLVAHSGVAALARELLPVLMPYIRDTERGGGGGGHLVFAGHSLGGSLAQMMWAMCIMTGYRSPDNTSCHTFGSPPVLAHAAGGGGTRVLRLLRAPPAAAINWVLEHDPVPRALLTADPYFAAARRAVPGLSALLALRGAVLGEGAALSSGRFLYETVGEQLLLRWSAQGGCEVVPVSEAEAESLLQMALDEAVAAPVRSLQHWLDHHHASYHHDLETAALAAYRRLVRSQRIAAAEQQEHLADGEEEGNMRMCGQEQQQEQGTKGAQSVAVASGSSEGSSGLAGQAATNP